MATTKVKGFVVGGTNVKEKDKIIRLFTLEKGIISVTMKGVRGEKAKMKSAKELLCLGEYEIEESPNYSIVTAVEIIDTFHFITEDIDKYYEACAIVDIVNKTVKEQNVDMFIELIQAFKVLAYGENIKKSMVLDKFLLFVFKSMGYEFWTDKCSSCGAHLNSKYLNLDVGEIVCPACKLANSIPVSDACMNGIKILSGCEYDDLSTVNFSTMVQSQIHYLLSNNYEWRTGFKVLSLL